MQTSEGSVCPRERYFSSLSRTDLSAPYVGTCIRILYSTASLVQVDKMAGNGPCHDCKCNAFLDPGCTGTSSGWQPLRCGPSAEQRFAPWGLVGELSVPSLGMGCDASPA